MDRKVYVYSTVNNYIEDDYLKVFKDKKADLFVGTVELLKAFIESNKDIIQLDVETNVTNRYTERELYVIQIGTKYGEEQHIIEYINIDKDIKDLLIGLFKSSTTFITHNGKFEYIVLYKTFGIYLKNFQDTFLAAKLLSAGINIIDGYNGLQNQILIRLGIDIPKESQTTFDGGKMTPVQLLYADTDVLYMGNLLDIMINKVKANNLMLVYNLEIKALRPIGDYTINGVEVDTKALAENVDQFTCDEVNTKKSLINVLKILDAKKEKERIDNMLKLKFIQPYDEVLINWGSSTQKRNILNYLYGDKYAVKSVSVPNLIKLSALVDDNTIVELFITKKFAALESLLTGQHMDFLKKNGLFVNKGSININFGSHSQVLSLFRLWYPKLSGVGVKALAKIKHPLVDAYKLNVKASKLVSSFGQKMFDYIEEDGRIHGSFTQIVPSGSRSSSSKPNLQQMPSTESYRRIFVPRKGWSFIDADYSSAELFLAAFLSKDPNMLFAVKNGYDMHSYSASLIFGKEWASAGGSDKPVGKPSTKEANDLRKTSKSLSFSLLYGTGVKAFSENIGVKLSEGKELMEKYFNTFPKLAEFFKASGQEALNNGYVREPFFGRVRFFDKPKNGMEVSHNKNAGMNYKPQAANGSIMKYAISLMKKHIEENDLDHKVKLLLFVHDQQLSEARDDFAKEWSRLQVYFMEKAALHAIPSGELKADSMILKHWTK